MAVNHNTCADMNDAGEAYRVMYDHIVHFKYYDIVGAFNEDPVN
jgi:hypothetical protein